MNDLSDLHAIFGDSEVMRHVENPYSREKTEKFLREFCVERKPPGAYAAVSKALNKVIGYVLFKEMDEEGVYEIGWLFNRDFWRQGYAFEICSALIEYGFTAMKIHKICAEAIDAVKSVGLMKKLGMSQEGVQRKQTKALDGSWADLYWYGILESDR